MALTLAEIKELIEFGRAHGLQSVSADGVAIVYGGVAEKAEDGQAADVPSSTLPEELRHYSALGKAAFGKAR
jgi:hypothetical protein